MNSDDTAALTGTNDHAVVEEGVAGGSLAIGDRVEKVGGASWRGCIVGTYSTTLTPEGYAVESENEPGSVQIYPVRALRLTTSPDRRQSGGAGWIVGNGAGDQWRAWIDGSPQWVQDRSRATRYARREDAEEVHREDEDAWIVQPFASPKVRDGEEAERNTARLLDQTAEELWNCRMAFGGFDQARQSEYWTLYPNGLTYAYKRVGIEFTDEQVAYINNKMEAIRRRRTALHGDAALQASQRGDK